MQCLDTALARRAQLTQGVQNDFPESTNSSDLCLNIFDDKGRNTAGKCTHLSMHWCVRTRSPGFPLKES